MVDGRDVAKPARPRLGPESHASPQTSADPLRPSQRNSSSVPPYPPHVLPTHTPTLASKPGAHWPNRAGLQQSLARRRVLSLTHDVLHSRSVATPLSATATAAIPHEPAGTRRRAIRPQAFAARCVHPVPLARDGRPRRIGVCTSPACAPRRYAGRRALSRAIRGRRTRRWSVPRSRRSSSGAGCRPPVG